MEKYLSQERGPAYSRKRYKKWKQLGLCSNCGKSKEPGFNRCRKCRLRQKRWYRSNAASNLSKHKQYRASLRMEVIQAYGGPFCSCCGEFNIEFLTLDHVKGGGRKHRRKVGSGWAFYLWLKRRGFPKGYRVLCMNCNFSLGVHGYCPHKETKP